MDLSEQTQDALLTAWTRDAKKYLMTASYSLTPAVDAALLALSEAQECDDRERANYLINVAKVIVVNADRLIAILRTTHPAFAERQHLANLRGIRL